MDVRTKLWSRSDRSSVGGVVLEICMPTSPFYPHHHPHTHTHTRVLVPAHTSSLTLPTSGLLPTARAKPNNTLQRWSTQCKELVGRKAVHAADTWGSEGEAGFVFTHHLPPPDILANSNRHPSNASPTHSIILEFSRFFNQPPDF